MNFFVTDCMCIMLLFWIEKKKYGKRHLYVYCLVIEIAMGCWNEQTKFLLLSWNLYMYKINYWKMLLFWDTFYLVMDFEYSFCIWHTQEWKVVSTFSFMSCCIFLLEKHNRVLIYTKNVWVMFVIALFKVIEMFFVQGHGQSMKGHLTCSRSLAELMSKYFLNWDFHTKSSVTSMWKIQQFLTLKC